MQDATRYEIRLAPQAEAAVRALPAEDRDHLRRVMEGIADLAALAPPQYPGWFRRRHVALPLMRLQLGELMLSYELDCDQRALRVCALARVTNEVGNGPSPYDDGRWEARSA